MAKKHRKRQADVSKPEVHPRRRVPIWLPAALLVLFLAGIAGVGVYLSTPEGSRLGSMPSGDVKNVVGRWIRPDGGYVIEVRSANSDGKLDASYSNQERSINVARAEAKSEGGKVTMHVELRDEGYPGSYYTLTHDPAADRLAGVYHQLATGQQFPVAFERIGTK